VLIDYYMDNAALLRQTMLDLGLKVRGSRASVLETLLTAHRRHETERYKTKVTRLYRWEQVFFLLQEHSKHSRQMVITPKASTSS